MALFSVVCRKPVDFLAALNALRVEQAANPKMFSLVSFALVELSVEEQTGGFASLQDLLFCWIEIDRVEALSLNMILCNLSGKDLDANAVLACPCWSCLNLDHF